MHRSREGRLSWIDEEGFRPVEGPFDPKDVKAVFFSEGVEIPGPGGCAGRVLCASPNAPGVVFGLSFDDTGVLVRLDVGGPATFGLTDERVAGGLRYGAGVTLPMRHVSARLLRDVPLGEIEREAREHLRWELAARHHSGHLLTRPAPGKSHTRRTAAA